MELLKELEKIGALAAEPMSLLVLFINLVVGVILALALRWHYQRYASVLSNRQEFSRVFPFLVLTTTLIIMVVKSSLALSLGLVGALSIVRFRAPIKEPEELVYLFLAIAMGLGLGANQTLLTVLASAFILGAVAIMRRRESETIPSRSYLSINVSGSDRPVSDVHEIVRKHFATGNVRRAELSSDETEIGYLVEIQDVEEISALTKELRESFEDVRMSVTDQSYLPRL